LFALASGFLLSLFFSSCFGGLTKKDLRAAKQVLVQQKAGERKMFETMLPDAKETKLSPIWYQMADKAAEANPELLGTVVDIGGKLFVPDRDTHRELGRDALDSIPRIIRFINEKTFLDYCREPDIAVAVEMTKPKSPPEPGRFKPGVRHFYNPLADGIERGDKGLAKEAVDIFYSQFESLLESELIELASKAGGRLCHYLCDIIVPYHTIGTRLEDDWTKERMLEHLALEYAFAKKRRRVIATPHYIKGGLNGILARVEREAQFSHQIAMKVAKKPKALLGQNPFTEKEMDKLYERAVQLETDVLYTALVNSGKSERLTKAERIELRIRSVFTSNFYARDP